MTKKVGLTEDVLSMSVGSLRSVASTQVTFHEPKTWLGKLCIVNMATKRGQRVQVSTGSLGLSVTTGALFYSFCMLVKQQNQPHESTMPNGTLYEHMQLALGAELCHCRKTSFGSCFEVSCIRIDFLCLGAVDHKKFCSHMSL